MCSITSLGSILWKTRVSEQLELTFVIKVSLERKDRLETINLPSKFEALVDNHRQKGEVLHGSSELEA